MRTPFILIFTAFTSLLLLSACEDQSEDASSCRYYIQQDLDNEDYESAIERLNSTTCQDTYPDNEYLVDLASAQLGISGYTFPNILSAALDDSEDGSDALSDFTSSIAELKNDNSIEYLDLATDNFTTYLGADCSELTNKTSTEEGICLVQGVVSLTKTALALDFLSGTGDASIEDSETLDLSVCALQHSTGATVDADCTIETDSVTFANPEGTVTKSYTLLTIEDLDNNSEYFLETAIADTDTGFYSIAFTDGFCTNDFTETEEVTEDIHNNPLGLAADQISYICPSEEDEDDSVNDLLVTAFNDAINNIDSLTDDDDLQEAIDDFTSEITATGTDGDYTLSDIIDYLDGL
ncbi:hypothetical protein [Psychromonas algicola]|uniref:hypothetical protein n=1 Tax=Psychromonas algicola TaxID=2555642 RepID=UPI00106890BE|nr:hypothetical protein [Psychromonas sp. RZ5]TEW52994.1 hypothetical protein E2R67_00900 [Psychromonas sp. RZ5]